MEDDDGAVTAEDAEKGRADTVAYVSTDFSGGGENLSNQASNSND